MHINIKTNLNRASLTRQPAEFFKPVLTELPTKYANKIQK